MRIVECLSDTNIGGAGILLLNRLMNTDLNKYQVTVLLPLGARIRDKLCGIGVRCIELDVSADRSLSLRDVFKYCIALRSIEPDIVNCHGALSARLAAKLCGIRTKICTRHCVYPLTRFEKMFGCFNGYLSDAFIAVAESAKKNLTDMGVDPRKIAVIINGAQRLERYDREKIEKVKESLGIRAGEHVLILCGRLEECKGHEYFFKAVRELDGRGLEFCALIVGGGSLEKHLKELAEDLSVGNRLKFVGFVDDVTPYMNCADININCSVGTETSSLALSEGMSLGLPAVVSDYGGNPYMIADGVNGYVCAARDHVQMADRIERLMRDKSIYKSMSDKAFLRFSEELNAQAMAEKTNKLYDAKLAP